MSTIFCSCYGALTKDCILGNRRSFSINESWVTTTDGYLSLYSGNNSNSVIVVSVNDVPVMVLRGYGQQTYTFIKKGLKITYITNVDGTSQIFFYPIS